MPANNVPKKDPTVPNNVPSVQASNTDTKIIIKVVGPTINLISESKISNTDWQSFIDTANTTFSRFKPGYLSDYSQEDLVMFFLDLNLSIPLEKFTMKGVSTEPGKRKRPITVELTSNNMPETNNGMRRRPR